MELSIQALRELLTCKEYTPSTLSLILVLLKINISSEGIIKWGNTGLKSKSGEKVYLVMGKPLKRWIIETSAIITFFIELKK